jgi:hypothetical protein
MNLSETYCKCALLMSNIIIIIIIINFIIIIAQNRLVSPLTCYNGTETMSLHSLRGRGVRVDDF